MAEDIGCVCVFVCVCAASVCQTALFEVAGTGALTAWWAPAGYWPTDGAEGGVYRVGVGGWVEEVGVEGGDGEAPRRATSRIWVFHTVFASEN